MSVAASGRTEFALDLYTRRAKLSVKGLARSYGPQTLRIYRMKPEMGPPDVDEIEFPAGDISWEREWEHFRKAILEGLDNTSLLGGLDSARYALARVGEAYRAAGYTGVTGTTGFAASLGADR